MAKMLLKNSIKKRKTKHTIAIKTLLFVIFSDFTDLNVLFLGLGFDHNFGTFRKLNKLKEKLSGSNIYI